MYINIIEYFEDTVKKFGKKIAAQDETREVDFLQIKSEALKISTAILNVKDTVRQSVCIFLPRSIDALVSIAGILYSGNIYVPLDTKNPAQRLAAITSNIKPFAIITDKKNAPKIANCTNGATLLFIEDILANDTCHPRSHFAELIDVDPAYIINTSGSTGIPKGVTVAHRSVIDYIEWLKNEPFFKTTPDDVIGNQSPFYFDKSIFDIYHCLLLGLKLVIIPDTAFMFPIKLLQILEEKKVTFIFWVPSILATICNFDLLSKLRPQYLKKITVSGEVLRASHLNYWLKFYPDALFANCYGPTEITDLCAYYVVERKFADSEDIPIGKPCRNIGIVLLDKDGREITSPDIDGELCVRGTCLSLGYYNDFERTNSAFTQNPANPNFYDRIYHTRDIACKNSRGELLYKGRMDFQIKRHGFRIELGEIEKAAQQIPQIKNSCVVYDNVRDEIVMFYQAQTQLEISQINAVLIKVLAKYMLPQKIVKIDDFPLNANGKIDRKKLLESLK